MADKRGQGDGRGRNPNSEQKPRQDAQQKLVCLFCQTEVQKGAEFCPKCREPIRIQCPECKAHIENNPNKKGCEKCGAKLKPNKEQETQQEKKWVLEVSHTGANGQYQLGIQVTENGIGKESKVWIGYGSNVEIKQTNDIGFLDFPVQFTCRKLTVVIRIEGTQANTKEITLDGPAFQCPPGIGFLARIKARRKYNQGR